MNFILLLDYAHLDEPVFLKSLSQSLGELRGQKGIILHADSSYTDRIIQTGVLSDVARRRSMKDLNNRLVALLADNGVAAVGLNGYQRNIIHKTQDGDWQIDQNYLLSFPDGVNLVLSCLVSEEHQEEPQPASLSVIGQQIAAKLNISRIITFTRQDAEEVFSSDDSDLPFNTLETNLSEEVLKSHLPEELTNLPSGCIVTSTRKLETALK